MKMNEDAWRKIKKRDEYMDDPEGQPIVTLDGNFSKLELYAIANAMTELPEGLKAHYYG